MTADEVGNAPEVKRDDEFTPLEFQVILGWALVGGDKIVRQLGITEDLSDGALMTIYKKLGTSGSGLIEFARGALNAELRRRKIGLMDGSLGPLSAVEMQLDLLRREAEAQSNPLAAELERLGRVLAEAVENLRSKFIK